MRRVGTAFDARTRALCHVRAIGVCLIGLEIIAPDPARRCAASSTAPVRPVCSIARGQCETLELGAVKSSQTYRLVVTLETGVLGPDDSLRVELTGPGSDHLTKELHAGDPDFYLPYRPRQDAPASLVLVGSRRAGYKPLSV